jgi:hypothetical protein
VPARHHLTFTPYPNIIFCQKSWLCSYTVHAFMRYVDVQCVFIIFLAGRHLCFYGASRTCILQLSKCPPADAHVHSVMETKMAAGWEYDEYIPNTWHIAANSDITAAAIGCSCKGLMFWRWHISAASVPRPGMCPCWAWLPDTHWHHLALAL